MTVCQLQLIISTKQVDIIITCGLKEYGGFSHSANRNKYCKISALPFFAATESAVSFSGLQLHVHANTMTTMLILDKKFYSST